MGKDIIRVKAVQDKEFKESYWSFNIENELAKAFQEFEKRFGVGFELTEIEEWNSIGSRNLNMFPFSLFQAIPKNFSIEEIIEYLVYYCRSNMGLLIEVCQDEKDEISDKIKNQAATFQLGFLDGRLNLWMKKCFFQDLEKKKPISPGIGAIFAFSGKISILSRTAGCVRASASIFSKEAYALMGNSCIREKEASKIILHEIGHLFGAGHTKRNKSVMKQGQTLTYNFDIKNRKIIRKKIKQIKGLI